MVDIHKYNSTPGVLFRLEVPVVVDGTNQQQGRLIFLFALFSIYIFFQCWNNAW